MLFEEHIFMKLTYYRYNMDIINIGEPKNDLHVEFVSYINEFKSVLINS